MVAGWEDGSVDGFRNFLLLPFAYDAVMSLCVLLVLSVEDDPAGWMICLLLLSGCEGVSSLLLTVLLALISTDSSSYATSSPNFLKLVSRLFLTNFVSLLMLCKGVYRDWGRDRCILDIDEREHGLDNTVLPPADLIEDHRGLELLINNNR